MPWKSHRSLFSVSNLDAYILLTHTCTGAACADWAFANLRTATIVNIVGDIAGVQGRLNSRRFKRSSIHWSCTMEFGQRRGCQCYKQDKGRTKTHLGRYERYTESM